MNQPTDTPNSQVLPLTTAEEKSVLTTSGIKETETDARETNSKIDATTQRSAPSDSGGYVEPTQDNKNGFRKADRPQRPPSLLFLKSLALVGLLGGLGFWAFLWRIPVVYMGQGIVIVPQQAVALQSRSSGQVIAVNVKVGELVKKGQAVAKLDLAQLRQQIRQVENNIQDLESQRTIVVATQNQRTANTIRQIEKQRLALESNLRALNQLNDLYTAKAKTYQTLVNEGVIAPLSVYVTQLDAQLQSNRVQIANIIPQLAQLAVQERQIRLQDEQANYQRDNQINNLKREKRVLETELFQNGNVVSQYTGTLLDLSATVGQFVSAGTRLGTINQLDTKQPSMKAITFFTVGEAKRLFPGMEIAVTPNIDYRRRYGGIVSKVISVSKLPSTLADISRTIGNNQLASALVAQQAVLRVNSVLEQDPSTTSGFKWTISKGPNIPIQDGTTTQVWATVEKRTPISWVIPGIRKLTGIYGQPDF